jgi:spore coat polysaccharide biosynthesis protein SpsF (cytidylyltransferase family)
MSDNIVKEFMLAKLNSDLEINRVRINEIQYRLQCRFSIVRQEDFEITKNIMEEIKRQIKVWEERR